MRLRLLKGRAPVRLRSVLLSQRVSLAIPSVCAAWEALPPRAHLASGAEHTFRRRLRPGACELPAVLSARTVGLCSACVMFTVAKSRRTVV